tara:strand:+ start:487 stop:771 length:285 start_codon:yes stop_codon:yes gene_type:complete
MLKTFLFCDGIFAGMRVKCNVSEDQCAQEITGEVVKRFLGILEQLNLLVLVKRLKDTQFALRSYETILGDDEPQISELKKGPMDKNSEIKFAAP